MELPPTEPTQSAIILLHDRLPGSDRLLEKLLQLLHDEQYSSYEIRFDTPSCKKTNMKELYNIESYDKRENATDFFLSLNPEHAIFQGHFPERPVLPGVCSIEMIKACAEKLTECSTRLIYMPSCKFIQSIDPNVNRHIRLKLSVTEETPGTWTVAAEGFAAENCFIKLKAKLQASEDSTEHE